jgi:hypothetical protein
MNRPRSVGASGFSSVVDGWGRQWFELSFPTGLSADEVLELVRSWSARRRRGWFGHASTLVLETEARAGGWCWRLGVTGSEAETTLAQLHRVLPEVAVKPTDRPALAWTDSVELRLRSSLRPMRIDEPQQSAGALLSAMSGVIGRERLLLQWVVGPWLPRSPVPNPTDQRRADHDRPLGRILAARPELDSEAVRALRAKQSEPVFGTLGRIAVMAASPTRGRELLGRAFAGLQTVRQPGVGLIRRNLPSRWVVTRATAASPPLLAWPCPLSAAELVGVIGWPVGGPKLAGIEYVASRLLPALPAALVSAAVAETMGLAGRSANLRVLADSAMPNQDGRLVLRPKDALRHLHVIGPTGSGKSTLLANLICQDIVAGRGVVVIEPKADLVNEVLQRIPPSRVDDVVVIDGADTIAPVGLGGLSARSDASRDLQVDQLLGLMHSLWRDSWGPRTNDVLHAGLRTLALQSDGSASLVALPMLLTNPGFRRRAVAAAVTKDPWGLAEFWAWYESLSVENRAQVIGPVMSKLRGFLLRPGLRGILGQPEPRFHLSEVFTRRRILLVDLAKGISGSETVALLGSILVAQLWQQIQTRSRIRVERRHPVMVYVDEFQNYLHLPTAFAEVLTEARSYGVGLHLAHQHLGQLSAEVRDAVLANAQSRVVFRLGHTDARVMAAGHPELDAEDITGLGRFEAYAALVARDQPSPYASVRTLPLAAGWSNPAVVRARSRAQFGVPLTQTDAYLRGLSQPANAADGTGTDESFGVRRHDR